MDRSQYHQCANLFVEIAKAQPALIQSCGHGAPAGKRLAEMAWAFIDEFSRQYDEKVKASD
ncbi:hypothetical protein [Bordetella bronchiseptica]|uniref:hypothetical protein n=1 Tax=Bordetella bronchiseptica TaxID=518 RepID=UPI0002F859EF|nr:hypothetical protein [Bordetella bronchiseptica]